jgi:hypothetical protein
VDLSRVPLRLYNSWVNQHVIRLEINRSRVIDQRIRQDSEVTTGQYRDLR